MSLASQLSSRIRWSSLADTAVGSYLAGDPTVPGSNDHRQPSAGQQMLWIDGVGGYLVCLADDLLLGQPTTSSQPDIALMADLSRRHARIRREAGGYLLTPQGPTCVNGLEIEGPALLSGGEEIALGDAVRMRFDRPHALSTTALLRVVSGHRTTPSADAILLMAESCVLGPKRHSHIRCPGWSDEVILFRSSEGLLCRSTAELTHNGIPASGPFPIRANSRVSGQDFSLTVEDL